MDQTNSISKLLDHHIAALLGGSVEEILEDYHQGSLVYTPDGPVQGLEDLRSMFAEFLSALPAAVLQQLQVLRKDIHGETAYILWRAGEQIPLGTDTYVIRNGKIDVQSYAAYLLFPR